jgi:hypothetical protein
LAFIVQDHPNGEESSVISFCLTSKDESAIIPPLFAVFQEAAMRDIRIKTDISNKLRRWSAQEYKT